jgi:hypothetical protein
MNISTQPYHPPRPRWIPVARRGKLLFKFDPLRGLIEIQERGQVDIIDLAEVVAAIEQEKVAA